MGDESSLKHEGLRGARPDLPETDWERLTRETIAEYE
jgi:hypothetical protein